MVPPNAITAAVVSTALISLAPNVLLILFPRYASGEGEHSPSLALGQALAAGGLLGDVFLHTIPHAAGVENVGLWILLGFFIFLMVDMIIRSYGSHSHHHHHDKQENRSNNKHDHHHSNTTSTIFLNLAADALHNFTDGLAIGASFASVADDHSSVVTLLQSRGGLATLSILFHEIPVSKLLIKSTAPATSSSNHLSIARTGRLCNSSKEWFEQKSSNPLSIWHGSCCHDWYLCWTIPTELCR